MLLQAPLTLTIDSVLFDLHYFYLQTSVLLLSFRVFSILVTILGGTKSEFLYFLLAEAT